MTRFKLIGAAAMLSLLIATGAHAQAAIDEPGLAAFNYPMGDPNAAAMRTPADARAMMLSVPRMRSHVVMRRAPAK